MPTSKMSSIVAIHTHNLFRYTDKIEKAYDLASRKLLDLLCNELDLLNRLRYDTGLFISAG